MRRTTWMALAVLGACGAEEEPQGDPVVTDEPAVPEEPADTDGPADTDEPAATEEPADERVERILALAPDTWSGNVLFQQRCQDCHGYPGNLAESPACAEPVPVDMGLPVEEIVLQVLDGGYCMPPFAGVLTEAEIANVSGYVDLTW